MREGGQAREALEYAPRRPETTIFSRVVQHGLEAWLGNARRPAMHPSGHRPVDSWWVCFYTHTMSKRLQVLLAEAELAEIRRLARQRKVTVADWVRQAIRAARRSRPSTDADKKLAAIREAARLDFPTSDIHTMLAEIERGYGVDETP